jgi:5-formyltetrahydrofolate cyclo-ligase
VHLLLESDLLNGAQSVALFAAMPGEADPGALEPILVERGIAVAYPRVSGPRDLSFHQAHSHDLVPAGPWGIREPAATLPEVMPDAYVVPGLGFTREGDRLGYGRGYFDRVLAVRGEAIAVGFAFACQVLDRLPIESHDQRVDAIVTGRELIMVKK